VVDVPATSSGAHGLPRLLLPVRSSVPHPPAADSRRRSSSCLAADVILRRPIPSKGAGGGLTHATSDATRLKTPRIPRPVIELAPARPTAPQSRHDREKEAERS